MRDDIHPESIHPIHPHHHPFIIQLRKVFHPGRQKKFMEADLPGRMPRDKERNMGIPVIL
jgi:hypothetical protein